MARQTSDYTRAASAVVQNMDSAYAASRSNSFNPGEVAKTISNANADRYKTFIRTAGELGQTKINSDSRMNQYEATRKTAKEIKGINEKGRFAGKIAALSNTGIGYMNLKQMQAEDKALADATALREENYLKALETRMSTPQDSGPRYTEAELKTYYDTHGLVLRDGKLVKDEGWTSPHVKPPSDPVTPETGTQLETTPKPSSATPTAVKGIRGEVYNYLTQDKGLSKNKALGLMANIDRESSFQIAPAGGDNGNSFGMFQWNNTYGRSDVMKKNVKDWQTNWKGQIDHALSSNQLPEYNTVTQNFLNKTFTSSQQAADYWMKHWERPAHQERDSARHTQFLSGYNF